MKKMKRLLTLLLLLTATTAWAEKIPYASLVDGVLTFKYEEHTLGANEWNVANTGDNNPGWYGSWGSTAKTIQRVVFDESFKDARPVKCTSWFAYFENITEIEGLANLNTSDVTGMNWMFYDCKSIVKLDLSTLNTEKVESMNSMFQLCLNLEELNLSCFNTSNVTNMSQMFLDCGKLKTIMIGSKWNVEKVTESSNSVRMFQGCTSLVGGDGTLFDSNYTDKTKAYAGEGGYMTSYAQILKYTVSGDEVTITGFADGFTVPENYDLVIPDEIEGKKVVAINASAFNWYNDKVRCGKIATVTVGNNVEAIQNQAFWGCSSVTSVTLPESLLTIGEQAFGNCSKLEAIDIPDNVTSIGYWAFYSAGIKSAKIGKGVTTIANQAFKQCGALASIEFAEGSQLSTVGNSAFDACTALKSIVFPASVTSLGATVFASASALRVIDMRECTGLTITTTERKTWSKEVESTPLWGAPAEAIVYLPKGCEVTGDNVVNTDASGNSTATALTVDQTNGTTFLTDIVVSGTVTNARAIAASDADAYTLCVPYDMTLPEGMKAYTMKEKDGDGNLVFTEVTTIEANRPYLVTASSAVSNLDATAVTVKKTEAVDDGTGDYSFVGTLVRISNADAAAMGAYILQAAKTWHPVRTTSKSAYIAAGRAYIVPKPGVMGAPQFSTVLGDGGTTAVQGLKTVGRDGSVTYYDLQGRRLDGQPKERGIYIMNGKKVVKP